MITALTAQNTQGVSGILPISCEFIEQQLDAVFSDLNVVAVKVGMLSDAAIIRTVVKKIKQYKPAFVVVDPVMVTRNGDLLLHANAIECLKSELFPLADVITPNLHEAAALIATEVAQTEAQMHDMVVPMRKLDVNAVLVKGGYLKEEAFSTDLLIESTTITPLMTERIQTLNTHGTGCSLSSAIASYLAQGHSLLIAVQLAKHYITDALIHADALNVGQGHGPVDHFFALKKQD